ncbi:MULTISPECIES: universal stress protein [Methanosphaera]|uniref:Predicted universal stress protein n=2 Tax=Methanosphaera stadtmanae TaxID=2317 RepID=Q2NEH2_METST|nr:MULTISPECIES: universal stress protein [Methanosphaera]ABC57781.1 predicted universal stress protein [Methanosphaera stadtmanae DSM 3091]MEE0489496.1 universal stress protein [Methanosphaera stadtmanae]OEC89179.1 universal stress protein UspA [Methanosphaera sp. A6]RAP02470.1 universal stress protein UspA [Methanosphaera stadtmanae]RAP46309.1 MAG: universal stress protein UspA [Methanosphaera sp. DEW79]
MYKKILLPTDGSKNSEKAIEHALRIAELEDSEIIILNVVDSVYLTGLPEEDLITKSELILEEESQKIINHVKSIIENMEEEKGFKIDHVKLTPRTEEGNAADVILKLSEKEDVDLIVIASSGKHMLDRFLLGSVTEKTVRHSTVPILVIPNK